MMRYAQAVAAARGTALPGREFRAKTRRCRFLPSVFLAVFVAAFTAPGTTAARAQENPLPATTVQLPTFGVAIDAQGVLNLKMFEDPQGRLRAEQIAAGKTKLARNLVAPSRLRKVSLARLQRAMAERIAAGEPLDDAMLYLAGLQRLQFAFIYPEQADIVLAGPAEGFFQDPSGRVVGMTTFRPVLELRDLAVALRAFPPGRRDRPFVGCTINPNEEGLKRFVQFQKNVPNSVPERQRAEAAVKIARGVREALGMADIVVFGVPPDTHFAHVLIEADYRMKRIGIGLEPPPVKMTTFLGAANSAAEARLQRWWFTPHYECLRVSTDRTALELVGQGVQLLSEDKVIGPDGKLLGTAKATRASELYTAAFTQKYPEIASVCPVYAQLRNLIDMLVVAAMLQQEDAYGRAHFRLHVLADEERFAVRGLPVPRQVACVANAVWKGNRLLAPAGGGVSIQPHLAIAEEALLRDDDGKLTESARQARAAPPDAWWWD